MPIFLNGIAQSATESTGDITVSGSSIAFDANQTDGASITHDTTLHVTSNLVTYETEMVEGSFTTKQYVDDELSLKINSSEKAVSNGVAPLDAFGHVPIENLPPAALGVSSYLGVWHADTNTPTIANGTGSNGDYYRVDAEGTQDLGAGSIAYYLGDIVVYDSADNQWHRIGDDDHDAATLPLEAPFTPVAGSIADTDSIQDALEKLQYQVTAISEIEHVHPLQDIMDEGSTALNIPTNVSIQTVANMTLQSTGAFSTTGSSTSLTATGSHTQTFDSATTSATVANGCQLLHDTTLKVNSDTPTYEANMTSDSLVPKSYVDAQVSGGGSSGVVGDIKASMLTAAQMAAQDSTFVVADGSDCTGSDYHTLTGNTTVPDLRGQFLRGLDLTGTVDPDGAGRTLGDQQDDETAINSLQLNVRHHSSSGLWHDSTHQVAGAGDHDPAEYQNANALRGGLETRPTNVAVQYFIKINN